MGCKSRGARTFEMVQICASEKFLITPLPSECGGVHTYIRGEVFVKELGMRDVLCLFKDEKNKQLCQWQNFQKKRTNLIGIHSK